MQENKLALKFNFTKEWRWPVLIFSNFIILDQIHRALIYRLPKEWHWTAFTILAMFLLICVVTHIRKKESRLLTQEGRKEGGRRGWSPTSSTRGRPEAQNSRRHCRPEFFCTSQFFLQHIYIISSKLNKNIVNIVWKFSRQSGNMPDSPGKFPEGLESFPTSWKVFEELLRVKWN